MKGNFNKTMKKHEGTVYIDCKEISTTYHFLYFGSIIHQIMIVRAMRLRWMSVPRHS